MSGGIRCPSSYAKARSCPSRVEPGLPLGIGALGALLGDITRVDLQPGDGVLLYTDGVTECRMPDGSFSARSATRPLRARARRWRLTTRSGSPTSPPTAIEHSQGDLRDDATMLYLRWEG